MEKHRKKWIDTEKYGRIQKIQKIQKIREKEGNRQKKDKVRKVRERERAIALALPMASSGRGFSRIFADFSRRLSADSGLFTCLN